MNRITLIVAGVLATVIASLFGLVLIPDLQFQELQPRELTAIDGSVKVYPLPYDDFSEAPGKQVYKSLGCVYCHSQQVRPSGFGSDLERGWGDRRSVPLDYIQHDPPLLGTMRTGPDLANIAVRQPSEEWHFLHLYDPRITSPGSVMPPFKFLFESSTGEKPDAPRGTPILQLPQEYAGEPTWIVPKGDAVDLVAYLIALEQPFDLEDVR